MSRRIVWMILMFLPFISQSQEKTPIHIKTPLSIVKYSDIHAVTTMSVYSQSFKYDVLANIQTNYDFKDIAPDGYNLQVMLASINTQLSSDGVKMSFNSNKDTANIDTVFAKPLSDILGNEDHVLIDSFGVILHSDTSILHRKANEYLTSTLLLGNDYGVGHQLDILFNVNDSLKVGSEWVDSTKITDGERIDTFTIEKIYNNVIYISNKGIVKRNLQIQQGGERVNAFFEGSTEGKMQVSTKTNFVNSRTVKFRMNSEIVVNEQKIPINSEVELNEHIQ